VDPPAVDGEPGLGKRALPGEDVRIDGVYERAVQVEDQSAQVVNLLTRAEYRQRLERFS
jgi:hypothetical protein